MRVSAVRTGVVLAAALCCAAPAALAQTASAPASAEAPEDATRWFREARYGMFIHWGLYSKAAGEWKGRNSWGISEWIMHRLRIPRSDYAELAKGFDPAAFDARAWVSFAKAAGFKYIVITSKHHDGFAMFRSKASPYNIVEATPFGRDPLKELADEARRQGIRLGFYYSQYQDWHEPDAAGNDWDFPKEGRDFTRYQKQKAEPQIRELLTNYGDVAILWFDTPAEITREAAQAFFAQVKALQPGSLVSSRVGHGMGDYVDLRDSEIPDKPRVGERPWEALFTVGESWAYSKWDHDPKSATQIVRILATVAGQGGNLLLNIGPDGEGRLPPEMTAPVAAAGDWLRANGDSIYGTGPTPFGPLPWGTATTRPGKLFLHVFTRPKDGRLVLPDIAIDVTGATLAGRRLRHRRVGGDLVIDLPEMLPDARDSVVTLAHRGEVKVRTHAALVSRTSGAVELNPFLATLSPGLKAERERTSLYFGVYRYFATIAGMKRASDTADWHVRVLQPGEYHLTIEYVAGADQAGREGVVEAGGKLLPFQVLETGPLRDREPIRYVTQSLGVVRFDAAGEHRIRLRPLGDGEAPLFTMKALRVAPHE